MFVNLFLCLCLHLIFFALRVCEYFVLCLIFSGLPAPFPLWSPSLLAPGWYCGCRLFYLPFYGLKKTGLKKFRQRDLSSGIHNANDCTCDICFIFFNVKTEQALAPTRVGQIFLIFIVKASFVLA